MDPNFTVTREELHNVQMEVKQVQFVQHTHAERLSRLEKRQADDAALRSVWGNNSPFPSILGGTPQQGPVQMPPSDVFDDFDDQGQNLIGSLHLEADDEPVRRGAASRANSVRFDESALQGSGWGGQGRQSGEFARPTSGMGGHTMMERSLSHKSDGRHSSAGHSVHSVHSVASGRASSLGLDTNFLMGGHDDDSPLDIPEPPPGFFVLGSVPSIIRCWLTTSWSNETLLYADVCTGSQKSTVDFSLVKELNLMNDIHRDVDGILRIRLPVFLAEARVTQPNSRSPSPAPQMPSITASFEITGIEQPDMVEPTKSIRVFIGSDTLRMHSADLLFSQNVMTLYGNDRDKLSVPFARPEDDGVFKYLATSNLMPERPKLNATAPEFVSTERIPKSSASEELDAEVNDTDPPEVHSPGLLSPTSTQPGMASKPEASAPPSEAGTENEKHVQTREMPPMEPPTKEGPQSENARRESSSAIWGSWRQGPANGSDSGQRENGPLSGYQPAGRGTRGMKVLKATKSGSSSARTGAAYEPAPPPRTSGEMRRKSTVSGTTPSTPAENGTSGGGSTVRWDIKRSLSTSVANSSASTASNGSSENKAPTSAQTTPRDSSKAAGVRSANPLGSGSAFAWIGHGGAKPKTTAGGE